MSEPREDDDQERPEVRDEARVHRGRLAQRQEERQHDPDIDGDIEREQQGTGEGAEERQGRNRRSEHLWGHPERQDRCKRPEGG